MYRLLIEDDEGRTTVVPLIRDELSIGRREGNTIRLTERNISRRHARVVRENNLFYVEDLGSYNGLRINGEKISGRRPVREGDLIQIGDYHLRILRDPGKTSTTTSETTAPVVPQAPVRAQARTEPLGLIVPIEEAAPAVETAPVITVPIEPAHRPSAPARPVAEAVEAPRLVVLTPGLGVAEIPVTGAGVVLGREGTFPLADRSLEREHARVVLEGQRAKIFDLAGGVRVNGEAVAVGELREGDLIELGRAKFRFAATRPAAVAPRAAAASPGEPGGGETASAAPSAKEAFFVPPAAPAPEEVAEDAAPEAPAPALTPAPARRGRRRLAYAGLGAGALAVVALALYLGMRPSSPEIGGSRDTPLLPSLPAVTPPVLAPPTAPPEPPSAPREADRLPAAPPAEAPGAESPPPSSRRATGEPGRRGLGRRGLGRGAEPPGVARTARAVDRDPAREPVRRERRGPRRLAARPPPGEGPIGDRGVAPPSVRRAPEPPGPPPAPPIDDQAAQEREAKAQARELFRRGTKELLSSPVRAVDIFRRALELDPSLADAHKNLGIAYSALENSAAAIRHYQRYLRMRPNAPDAEEVRQQLAEITRSGGP